MMYMVESFFFNFLRKKVEEGNKELDIGNYRLIFKFYIIPTVENTEHQKETNSQINVNELIFDVMNIDGEFVAQVRIDKRMGLLYIEPDRSEQTETTFLKALSAYVKRNKNSKTGKVVK